MAHRFDIKAAHIESNKSITSWQWFFNQKTSPFNWYMCVCAVSSSKHIWSDCSTVWIRSAIYISSSFVSHGIHVPILCVCAPLMHHYFAIVKTKDNTVFVRISIKTYVIFFFNFRLIHVCSLPFHRRFQASAQTTTRHLQRQIQALSVAQPLQPATAHRLL